MLNGWCGPDSLYPENGRKTVFLSEKEMKHIADLVAERLERRLSEILQGQGGNALVIERVEINTLPVTLRGSAG
ncbi:hypothetical protein RYF71_04570 [Wolbachia endosymbiont of Drosophila malagassya]|nr:hypothetical protein [Wolbachia endosymbiont of Drosophila malagassya]